MAHRYAELAFTDTVRGVQAELGSRDFYARMDEGEDSNHRLTEREIDFIGSRDSFYMATVSDTEWPYIQHRGGPAGFVRVLDEQTIGFADFRGNRQFISVGNARKNDRVSLFMMDYPTRTRLKLLGRLSLACDEQTDLMARIDIGDYRAKIDRGMVIRIEAFDWNCPAHITPRYTVPEIECDILPNLAEHGLS